MKKYLFLAFLAFSVAVKAQEIRIEGKKLTNEIRINRNPKTYRNIPQRGQVYRADRQSQLWLRVLEQGRFRVEIGGQIMENSTGLYRFFDLGRGMHVLSIYEGKYLIYRTKVDLIASTRLMLDFDGYALYLFDEIDLVSDFYDDFPNVAPHKYMRTMTDSEFEIFFRSYNARIFDSEKMQFFNIKLKNSYFTTSQIGRIIKSLSHDDHRLELAKSAYERCVDRENYYKLVDEMIFRSTKNALEEFLLQQY